MIETKFNFFSFLSAVFTRGVFALHCIIASWRVVEAYQDTTYFWVNVGLALIVIEAVYSLVVRKGQEYKW
jgi:hypothetical protein